MTIDPVTAAIASAIGAGAMSGLTETAKTAITDTYTKLKELLAHKCGDKSEVVDAVARLEARPDSAARKEELHEVISAAGAEQDEEILTAAQHLFALLARHSGSGITVQNNAPVQGQNIGTSQQITQHFGEPPKP
jgi:hypothetical protein